ncbi:tetratricopeptide repeat protein [bacterium]|nr:tetratricopeptide repeat protein [bacterium]
MTLESQPLRDHLEHVTGFSVPEDRWRSIAPRLLQRIARRGFADTHAYLKHLGEGPFGRHELEELLEVFTIRKTSFFRNPATFDALAREVLPPLFTNRARGAPPPSIWSAGCSTGEEPYSIAMVARALAPSDPRPCYILATDIVEAALTRARRGVYTQDVGTEIPERFRHLLDVGDGRAEVAEAVRSAVEFYAHNLVRDAYPRPASGSWDVIFCRNVIIYFSSETCRRVIATLWNVLAPGGALFLGHSEVLWGLEDRFDVVFADETFYYRKRRTPRPHLPRVAPTEPAGTVRASALPAVTPANGTSLDTPGPLPRSMSQTSSESARAAKPFVDKTPSRVMPALPFDLLTRAETSLASGDQEGAARTLRLAIARAPSWAPPRLLLGRLYADRGENEKANEELEVAVKVTPLDARAHMLLGMVRERKGEREAAEDAYRHAVYLEPDLASARYALAQIYRATNRPDRAKRELRNVIRALSGKEAQAAVKLTDGVSPTALVELCERELLELGE